MRTHQTMNFRFKQNKYKVAPKADRTHNGKVYPSKAEMTCAITLQADPTITLIIEQPQVPLGEDTVYKPDFFVYRAGANEAYFIDVKGVETADFKRNKRLWAKYGPLPLHIRKNGKVVEIVERDEA